MIEFDQFNKAGFPFVYYEGEFLSEETASYRRRVVYVSLIFIGAGFFSWISTSNAISKSDFQAEIFSQLSSQPYVEQLAPTFSTRIEGGKFTPSSPSHFIHAYGQHGLPPARSRNAFGRRVPANNPPAGSGLFGVRSSGKTPGKLPGDIYKGSVGPVKTLPGGLGIGGAGAPNPAGAGGGAGEFDDKFSVFEKGQKSKTFEYDYRSKYPKNKKKLEDQCRIDQPEGAIYILPKDGPVVPDKDSVVPMKSIMGEAPGLARQYKNLQKDEKATEQASTLLKKLGNASMTIESKDVRKLTGMKKVHEAKSKDVRVYFQMKDKTIEVIAPCLKTDQKASIKLLKKYFE